jgi:hypothetical protein
MLEVSSCNRPIHKDTYPAQRMFLFIHKAAILYAILYCRVTLTEGRKLQEFGNEGAKDYYQS